MTTIAWDGKTLAADSLVNGNGTRWGEAVKIWRGDDGSLFGMAGSMFYLEACRQWSADQSQAPPGHKEHMTLIHITPGGEVREWQGDGWLISDMEFIAWGSGEAFALGAMAMGASAPQAVEVSAKFNIYTGGTIRHLCLTD